MDPNRQRNSQRREDKENLKKFYKYWRAVAREENVRFTNLLREMAILEAAHAQEQQRKEESKNGKN